MEKNCNTPECNEKYCGSKTCSIESLGKKCDLPCNYREFTKEKRSKDSERNIAPIPETQKIANGFFKWIRYHLSETNGNQDEKLKNENLKLKEFLSKNMFQGIDSKENFPIFLQKLRDFVGDLQNGFTPDTKKIVIYAIKEYESAISKEEIENELRISTKKIEENKSETYLKIQERLK